MNRAQRSLTHIFKKTSKPAVDDVDDLAAVEESFRSSSFALLPSAVTPSRAPSNTLIASSRAPFFGTPVRFHIPNGCDKWPKVIDWCKKRGDKAIKKMQLRKNHQHPYYHEYIVIFTKGGHTYRIDRRPDADAPFDTIMRVGCTAYDTIEEIHPTSLRELDGTFDCVAELRWQGERTIDLLFVLSICFRIHNDKWTKRYTLQHYNCYFLSWTIIIIIMRNTMAWGTEALEHGVWPKELQIRSADRNVELEQEREQELELEIAQARIQELKWELKRKQVLARVYKLEGELELQRQQRWRLKLKLERWKEREQVRADVLWRVLTRLRVLGQLWEPEPEDLKLLRPRNWKKVQALALALALTLEQVPLVLGWHLAQGWKYQLGVQEQLQKLLQDSGIELPPDHLNTLAKTIPGRSWWLSRSVGVVMVKMMQDERGDIRRGLSDLTNPPASFEVSLNHNYANPVKSNTRDPELYKVTAAQLEQHMIEVIENHAERVARWKLGSKAEVKSNILDGMWRTWQKVSHEPMYIIS